MEMEKVDLAGVLLLIFFIIHHTQPTPGGGPQRPQNFVAAAGHRQRR